MTANAFFRKEKVRGKAKRTPSGKKMPSENRGDIQIKKLTDFFTQGETGL